MLVFFVKKKIFNTLHFYYCIVLSTINFIQEYIWYYFNAKTKYDIHSPFLYEWITCVLEDKTAYADYKNIEVYKKQLLANNTTIAPEDYGAGSKSNTKKLTLNTLFKNTAIQHQFGSILYKTIQYYQPKNIVELGTGTGIATLYMALANTNAAIYTIEGNTELHTIISDYFKQMQIHNVHLQKGNFNDVLPLTLQTIHSVDFAFIDGNHQKDATIAYYHAIKQHSNNNTILVFDDIRWSSDMLQAWNTIIADNDITLSLDLFRMGMVFFRKEIKRKQHYAIAC